MTEDTKSQQPNETAQPDTENAETPHGSTESQWDAVAQDFQRLGESIADALKSAWQNENTQRQIHDLKEGLHTMAEQVGQTVTEAKETIAGEEVKSEVKKAAEDVKGLGEKVYSEAKPVLLDVLKTIDDGIRKMIERLETPAAAETETPGESPADSADV